MLGWAGLVRLHCAVTSRGSSAGPFSRGRLFSSLTLNFLFFALPFRSCPCSCFAFPQRRFISCRNAASAGPARTALYFIRMFELRQRQRERESRERDALPAEPKPDGPLSLAPRKVASEERTLETRSLCVSAGIWRKSRCFGYVSGFVHIRLAAGFLRFFFPFPILRLLLMLLRLIQLPRFFFLPLQILLSRVQVERRRDVSVRCTLESAAVRALAHFGISIEDYGSRGVALRHFYIYLFFLVLQVPIDLHLCLVTNLQNL